MTQEELAQLVGISQPHMSNIESGRVGASWSTAKKLAKHTGTDATTWMDGTESEKWHARYSAIVPTPENILLRKFEIAEDKHAQTP